MLKQKIKNNSEGFTIIEVMIVLAIAGLILLIVFLAVPALQRSSRNTSRKNDASRVASAVSEFVSDNNGSLPGQETGAYVAATAATDGSTILKDAGTLGQLSLTAGASAQGANKLAVLNGAPGVQPTAADNEIILYEGATCSGATVVAGSTRQIAEMYPIEQNGGYVFSCISAL